MTNYQKVHDGILRLHQLFLDGKHDSAEADAIREANEEPWYELSKEERKSITELSIKLYKEAE